MRVCFTLILLGSKSGEIVAVRGITISMREGEITAILGLLSFDCLQWTCICTGDCVDVLLCDEIL